MTHGPSPLLLITLTSSTSNSKQATGLGTLLRVRRIGKAYGAGSSKREVNLPAGRDETNPWLNPYNSGSRLLYVT